MRKARGVYRVTDELRKELYEAFKADTRNVSNRQKYAKIARGYNIGPDTVRLSVYKFREQS